MATIPYFVELNVTIAAAGGLASPNYPVSERQTLTIKKIVWAASSAWGFYGIRNSGSRQFSNASQAAPLPSTAFQNGGSPNIGLMEFPEPLVVVGSDILYFDIINGAGAANTIQLTLFGSLDLGTG